jgi:hypothetical protein
MSAPSPLLAKQICWALAGLGLQESKEVSSDVFRVLMVCQLRDKGYDVGFERRDLFVPGNEAKPNIRGKVSVLLIGGSPIARKGREGWEAVREDVCADLWKNHRRSLHASEIDLPDASAQTDIHVKDIMEIDWICNCDPAIKATIERAKASIMATIEAVELSETPTPSSSRPAPRL